MAFDQHKNFAYSTVATAPSPATSGTSLVVAAGDGAKFPTPPFNATVWPIATQPTTANAEIVRVTAVSTDTLTITRAQESTSARTVIIGDQIAATITAQSFTDIESGGNLSYTAFAVGPVIQVVSTETGALASGTTLLPFDNTIPQNTEGDQYMSLSITPKSTTNKLVIKVVAWLSSSVVNNMGMALFQDTTANALAATQFTVSGSAFIGTLPLTHSMTAGTTSATTFKIRAGGSLAGTTSFNGANGVQIFGGVAASSITIWEYKA